MPSPTVQSPNEENMTAPTHAKTARHGSSERRVLGDVSPNVKVSSQTPAFLSKPLAGSPLKRSFTAAMEGGEGFTYLKRRKLSGDESLSQSGSYGPSIRDESVTNAESFRPVFQSGGDDGAQLDIPAIAEPSPTEPNTPTEEESSTQGSSAERKSFSSLINYDPSSQTSTSIFKTISNAEMLMLRLRVAMYKVRTNQVDVPFVDLEVDALLPELSVADSNAAAREAVEELRKEAQEIAARRKSAVPKLLPAPVLRPTAYSSRLIYGGNLPSSPPVLGSPDKLNIAGLPTCVSTPRRDNGELDSPPSSRGGLELTSSVVKGRVAEGLLGLRNAV